MIFSSSFFLAKEQMEVVVLPISARALIGMAHEKQHREVNTDGEWHAKLLSILKKVDTLERDLEIPHIFTSGEFDSNQTKFESLSNDLRIGVVSSSTRAGRIMLPFLRDLIDGKPHSQFMISMLQDSELTCQSPDEEIMKFLEELEENSMFPMCEQKIKAFYADESYCIRNIDEMDLWTYPRILAAYRLVECSG